MKKLLSVQQRAGDTLIAVCGSILVEIQFLRCVLFLGLPSDPVQIESIQLSPDPPKPGDDLTVTVDGIVSVTLSVGFVFEDIYSVR